MPLLIAKLIIVNQELCSRLQSLGSLAVQNPDEKARRLDDRATELRGFNEILIQILAHYNPAVAE